MSTSLQTYPVEFKGGLVTNLGPLQLGLAQPGAARRLVNFEPSIEGGYRRVLGYSKFSPDFVPAYGTPVVQGGAQTGTTLEVTDLSDEPVAGDTFTVAGLTETYTIVSVFFTVATKQATLTITPTLEGSPADKAALTFSNPDKTIDAIAFFENRALVARGGVMWSASSGGSWSKFSVSQYGEPLVNGAAQTGTSLVVDGFTTTPKVGDTFTIAGLNLTYTVADVSGFSGTGGTIVITPALDSSPADDAAITFRSAGRRPGGKHRFTRYKFGLSNVVTFVDGVNPPAKYDGTNFTPFNTAPPDVIGASHIAEFKNHIFFGKDNILTFTAPFNDTNFEPGDGAGSVALPHDITGLIVFREQLIVFCRSKIYRIVGSSILDFQLLPISLDIGCIAEDTIQEVGGDIVFLGPDGVRLLGATERIGDFNLAVASRAIQSEVRDLIATSSDFTSVVIRGKNQYRLFGYSPLRDVPGSIAILGTQFADREAQGFAWAELFGIKAYVADSQYTSSESEVIVFAANTGYVWLMESGNTYDGITISASFWTPFFAIEDPRIRKTIHRLTSYFDPESQVSGVVQLRHDFDQPNLIQPPTEPLNNDSTGVPIWGIPTWNNFTYSGRVQTVFYTQMIGSGFTSSIEYTFNNETPPFSIDAAMIEYIINDRK